MSKREALSRYNLIISRLRRSPASFVQISDHLLRESELQDYDLNVSTRTFQRDIKDILALYHIDIQYDRGRGVYFIESDSQPDINNRMLEAFDTFNALNIAGGLAQYVHFEQRHAQGTEHLYGLLHAVKNRVEIRFTYQKFWEDEASSRVVAPYALKEFRNRWYVLARDNKDGRVKSFSLDRLSDLEITNKSFTLPKDHDVEAYYRHCFGIISPNGTQPLEIVLSFEPEQGKYIKTLPLHPTQQILADDDDELRIGLTLYVTHDLVMELLSYGDSMRIIKPASLIKEVREAHKRAYEQY